MEGAATADPKRISASTGEELVKSSGQGWRTIPERICGALTISVPIPAVPTGSSLHPGMTRMGARQERISPQAGTAAQSTPGYKK